MKQINANTQGIDLLLLVVNENIRLDKRYLLRKHKYSEK